MRPVDKVALKVQKYLKQANKQASNREAGGGARHVLLPAREAPAGQPGGEARRPARGSRPLEPPR